MRRSRRNPIKPQLTTGEKVLLGATGLVAVGTITYLLFGSGTASAATSSLGSGASVGGGSSGVPSSGGGGSSSGGNVGGSSGGTTVGGIFPTGGLQGSGGNYPLPANVVEGDSP
jgi:hypothetical protein